MNFSLYRRHGRNCPLSGMHEMKCDCPIWAYARSENDVIRKSLGTKHWATATKRLAHLEADPQAFATNYTWERAVKDFQAAQQSHNLSRGTIRTQATTFRAFLAWTKTSDSSPRVLTLSDLEEWQQSRSGKIKPTTLAKETTHIKCLIRWLVDHQRSPDHIGTKLRLPQGSSQVTMPYTDDELRKLISVGRPRLRALMLVMLYTGLRISDAVQLKRGQLREDGKLLLRVEKTGVPLWIKLHPEALLALAAVPESSSVYYFWTGTSDLKTVCGSWWKAVRERGDKVGIKGVRPHRFRDTFAVRALLSGASIYAVQKLLGHTSVKTTEKHYSPWIAEMQAHLDTAIDHLPSL